MIANYQLKLSIASQPERTAPLQRDNRSIIFARLKFTQPQHSPGWAILWIKDNKIPKSVACFQESVAVIEDGRDIPPAFRPLGPNSQSLCIEIKSFAQAASETRFIAQFDG